MSRYYSCTIVRSTKNDNICSPEYGLNIVSERVALEFDNIEDLMSMLDLEYRGLSCEIIDYDTSCVFGTFIVKYKEFDYSTTIHKHYITVRQIESTVIENMAKKFREYRGTL